MFPNCSNTDLDGNGYKSHVKSDSTKRFKMVKNPSFWRKYDLHLLTLYFPTFEHLFM